MNKGLGMPHADVVAVLRDAFHLEVNRSTIRRAVDREARRGEATWHVLRDVAQRSMVNGIDETGWNVAAQLRWLWVVVSEQVTICEILPGRGLEQAASLLRADYEGWLNYDPARWASELHLACDSLLPRPAEGCSPAAAHFPLAVKAIPEKGLALRDRYNRGELSTHGLWTAIGRLEAELDRWLAPSSILRQAVPIHLSFLYCPDWMPPTMRSAPYDRSW